MSKKFSYDKYADLEFINKYAAIWSYGYLNGFGQTEGFYRAVNELGFSIKDKNDELNVLDVGCGVGRTSCDYAAFFRNAKVIGIDRSSLMIETAKRIVNNKSTEISFDLTGIGFGQLSIRSFGLSNASFVKASLNHYYSKSREQFDLILAVNFIDRTEDIEGDLRIIQKMLKMGGFLILTTPLNLLNIYDWGKYGSFENFNNLLGKLGFKIDVAFDNLIYREILDARMAHEEYNTAVYRVCKTE